MAESIRRSAVLLALLAPLVACGHAAPPPSPPPPPVVEAATVHAEDFVLAYRGPVSLEAWRVADLASDAAGRIRTLAAEEGERVRRGTILASIDAASQNARAAEIEARIAEADVEISSAQTNLDRVTRLLAAGVASREEADDASDRLRRAREARAAWAASLGGAAAEAEKTILRAPFDATVTAKDREVGEMASSGARLYRVEDLRAIRAVLAVPEVEIAGIRPGSRFLFSTPTGETFAGLVALVSPAAEARSRSIRVEARIENPRGLLRSGLSGEGEIVREVRRGAVVVPANAVLGSNGETRTVFVVEGDLARRRAVRLGEATDGRVEVTQGLRPGETIATSGLFTLADGLRVQVSAAAPVR